MPEKSAPRRRVEVSRKMKKVCIVKLGYYPLFRLMKRSADTLVSDGYQVDVICLRKKGEPARETIDGVNVYRLPGEHYRRNVFRYLFEYGCYFITAFLTLSWLSLKASITSEISTNSLLLNFSA